MIKKVLLSVLIIPLLLSANSPVDSFNYLHVGGWGQDKPFGANIGIGKRIKIEKIGYGCSADLSTLLHIPIVINGKAELLYFFSTTPNSFYTGAACGFGTLYFPNDGIFIKHGFYPLLTCEYLVGKQMVDAEGAHSFVNIAFNPIFSLQALQSGEVMLPTITASYAWEF